MSDRFDPTDMTLEVGGTLATVMMAMQRGVQQGREDNLRRRAANMAGVGARLHHEVGRRVDTEQALRAERARSAALEDELATAYKAMAALYTKLKQAQRKH